ncbi:MAG: hypothetical protein M3O15_11370, partial [Acidobacteriota bacterium]|nr:hypothetical protein [Acidobacteriota bacterium]
PYYTKGQTYDEYKPAYEYGWQARARHAQGDWQSAERDLESGWDKARGKSGLGWDQARSAVQDAWNRVDDRDRHRVESPVTGDPSHRTDLHR